MERRCDRLDRLALSDHAQQALLHRVEATRVAHRPGQGVDDARIEHRTTGAHLAHRTRELIPFSNTVLEQVRVPGGTLTQQRDRVLGFVVLGEDHDPGPRVLLADDPRRADPLVGEIGWHANIGHHHLGHVFGGSGEELVVVTRHANDVDVSRDGEESAHSLADDEVVVREHDANRLLQGHEATLVR